MPTHKPHLRPLSLLCAILGFSATATLAQPIPPRVELSVSAAHAAASGGKDDITQLKWLALAVGSEFRQSPETIAELKRIGVHTIRCINVDIVPGKFDAKGEYVMDGDPHRLSSDLRLCRNIGARPHIIIAQRVPDELRIPMAKVEEELATMGQKPNRERHYWNGDWPKLRAFWRSIFRYVLVEQGFKDAVFEVGNEPDINGQFPRLVGKEGPMGSKALYDLYFDVYRNVVRAAEEFEKTNPKAKVVLGGPGGAWVYTQHFGDFLWLDRFLADTAKERLRLDFIGLHYYSNLSSIRGEYKLSVFPSFTDMLTKAKKARDKHHPKARIAMTEWGPSYHINLKPESMVNANHIGTANSAAMLKAMLDQGVDDALFLVTNDPVKADPASGKEVDIIGWPSFFVNPAIYGRAWPKPPFHLADMVSRMAGTRLQVSGAREGVDAIISADPKSGKATALLWNYAAVIPENKAPSELGRDALVRIPLDSLRAQMGAAQGDVILKIWMVSEELSNAHTLWARDGKIDERAQLQLVEEKCFSAGIRAHEVMLPKCSVAFVSVTRG